MIDSRIAAKWDEMTSARDLSLMSRRGLAAVVPISVSVGEAMYLRR